MSRRAASSLPSFTACMSAVMPSPSTKSIAAPRVASGPGPAAAGGDADQPGKPPDSSRRTTVAWPRAAARTSGVAHVSPPVRASTSAPWCNSSAATTL
jgi:hypothetical protein